MVDFLNRHLIIAIPAFMAAGFLFGLEFDAQFLKPLILPFTFAMVYPMMVSITPRAILSGGGSRTIMISLVLNLTIIPLLAYALGAFFLADRPYMALGLLLAGIIPTSGMTVSWTALSGGNREAALKLTAIGFTIGAFATPFYAKVLLGAVVPVDSAYVLTQVMIIIFIPLSAAILTRRLLIGWQGEQKFSEVWIKRIPALSTLGMFGVLFTALALKARGLAAEPGLFLMAIPPLIVFYIVTYGITISLGRWLLNPADAKALIFGVVIRSISVALALAINAFGEAGAEAALFIAISYIIQTPSAAWFVKYANRVFPSKQVNGA